MEKKIKNVFDAPKGYFEKLPQQIQKRIYEKKQKKNVWQIIAQPKYALVLASVTLLLVFGGKYLMTNEQGMKQVEFTEISSQEISKYLLQEGINEAELVEYLQDTDSEGNSEKTAIEEILEDEADFEEIEELL